VCLDSPLVDLVRRETAGGARFAWAGANLGEFVAPNQEALFGLRSVHSYNPLFSSAYQDWAARYRKTQVRGTHDRRFLSVIRLEEFLRESAALTATTVILSAFEQDVPGLRLLGRFGPLRAYRVEKAPIHALLTRDFAVDRADGARLAPATTVLAAPESTLEHDDHRRFRLRPQDAETLLVVAQQFHPRWRAEADGHDLETLVVDGIFQGVRVPPGTEEVELAFQARVRWSWIPQAGFALAALVLLAGGRRRRPSVTRGA
jgi:MYXO-CTERM domain-containing protein